jgi:hypothetical protein
MVKRMQLSQAIDSMSDEQALFVRDCRVTKEMTWRTVAQVCADAWAGDWGSHQMAGVEICERAQWMLRERFPNDDWN